MPAMSFVGRIKAMFSPGPAKQAAFDAGRVPTSASAALDLEKWAPRPSAADRDIIPEKDQIEGRIIELVQNDGFAVGVVNHYVNNVVGDGLRLNSRPDWERIPGASEQWATDFAAFVEREYAAYVSSSRNYIDFTTQHSDGVLQALALRSWLQHGEILAVSEFERGVRPYGSCIQLIDPARLSTPAKMPAGNPVIRGGVEFDARGRVVAYWIADRHPRDYYAQNDRRLRKPVSWTRVEKFGRRDRQRVFHVYDPMRVGQSRGLSIFASIVRAMKMIDRVSDAALQAALMQTIFTMVVKSEMDWEKVMQVIGSDSENGLDAMLKYIEARGDYYEGHKINLDGVRALHLLPNEDLELKKPEVSEVDHKAFLESMYMEAARGTGMSNEVFTGNFGGTSFSAATMSNLESNRGHRGTRKRIMVPFKQWQYELLLEEMLIKNPEQLPRQADFYTYRDAICRSNWIGPPVQNSNEVQAASAAQIRLATKTTTVAMEAAERGMDFEELIAQLSREIKAFEAIGVTHPALELDAELSVKAAGKKVSQTAERE